MFSRGSTNDPLWLDAADRISVLWLLTEVTQVMLFQGGC